MTVGSITLNSGSGGENVSTDEIGGNAYQRVKLVDGTTDSTTVIAAGNGTAAGALRVVQSSSIEDSNNTTTTPLGISGTFTGTGTETLPYRSITIVIFADQSSAADGVSLEWSPDNTNWNHTAKYTYTASTDMSLTASVRARYFRVVYTNGGTGQGTFRMYTFMHPNEVTGNVRPLEYTLTGQESAEIVRGVLAADTGSGYENITATAGGNLKVSIEEGINTPADADATPTDAIHSQSFNMVYNGATWDFIREGGTAGSILVDGSGVTQPVSGTVTANPASGTIDTVTSLTQMNGAAISMNTGVRDAGTQRVTIATNDSVPVTSTALTDIETNTDYGAVVGGGAQATALRVTLANDSTGNIGVEGRYAHDGTTLGDPILGGARASNSIEGVTQVSNADLTHLQADLNGVLVSRPHTTLEEIVSERDTITTGTSTAFATAFAAPGAGNHLYVTAISVANTSSTDTFIDFQNGASGTVIWTMALPANGGANMTFDPPLKVADNTALAYQVGTGVTTAYISVNGFTAQG